MNPTPQTLETLLAPSPGFRSDAVARFVWQMDAQRNALLADVAGLTPEQLRWQKAPGTNSIGMLLAHVAYSENHLVQVGIEGKATSDTRAVIGIGLEEEGMPLDPGAPPSPALDGRSVENLAAVLERARAYTKRVAASLTDADLEIQVVRQRPDGIRRIFNVAWVFYHLIEHEAGHRGQINLLRHLQRLDSGG